MDYYDFSGGMVNCKSPYLMKSDEVEDISNFEIENGGLTVRDGTKKIYGPFSNEVKGIYKLLSPKGHEILLVDTDPTAEMVVAGTNCNLTMHASGIQVIHTTGGYGFLFGGIGKTMLPLYRRCDGEITLEEPQNLCLFLEQLEDDYTTDGDFPADLFGHNIIDSDTGVLYYCDNRTNASKETIHELIKQAPFIRLGKIGGAVFMKYTAGSKITVDMKKGYYEHTFFSISEMTSLSDIFPDVLELPGVTQTAFSCKHFVWHPPSMRYFAAGNKKNPTALYISEPNNWCSFSEVNVLYPHLNLGKITGLLVVEKSVVVCYEYGWSHYVGSDPTEDGQWSLLSVPNGTKFGSTICLTPGSVSFYSNGELMSFSSSMLTVQMLYSPSSSLYKFLSKGKVTLPQSPNNAFAYYRQGKYYLVLDDKILIYHVSSGAFTCYEGIACRCIAEDYSGRLLLGRGNYVVGFDAACHFDYQPETDTDEPISYRVCFGVLPSVNENEFARCTQMVVKTKGCFNHLDCEVKLSSEQECKAEKLENTSHLIYGKSQWNHRYFHSDFTETRCTPNVSGNFFRLEIEGQTDVEQTEKFSVLNVYLEMKKERKK